MSSFLSLNTKDFLKGLGITIGGSIIASAIAILNTGRLPNLIELKAIAISSISVGVAYILKNLFTNSSNEFAKKE
jgi:hypothetical protein